MSGSFFDVGTLDSHTAVIDWGDGSSLTSGAISKSGGSGTASANHVYANGGIYTITITLVDDDGAVVVKALKAVITGAGINNGVLYVIGTHQNDDVSLKLKKGSLNVYTDFYPGGITHKDFSAIGVDEIVIVLGDGNDLTVVEAEISIQALIDGGNGDDELIGGGGTDILLGGAGNDILKGGGNRDLVVGGNGADEISGGFGEDLLIAGRTDYDTNYVALDLIMAEWSRTDTIGSICKSDVIICWGYWQAD